MSDVARIYEGDGTCRIGTIQELRTERAGYVHYIYFTETEGRKLFDLAPYGNRIPREGEGPSL